MTGPGVRNEMRESRESMSAQPSPSDNIGLLDNTRPFDNSLLPDSLALPSDILDHE